MTRSDDKRLSDEKVTHLTHVLLKGLMDKKLLALKDEEGAIRKAIRQAIQSELRVGEEMDKAAKQKLATFSRKLAEGSPEWEVLYKKFMREEEVKRGR